MGTRIRLSNVGKHGFVIVIGLLMLYPLLWLISSSFKPSNIIFAQTGLIPSEFTFSNFSRGWSGIRNIHFGNFLTNSFIISLLSVVGNIISCSLTAYAFARLDFFFKKQWFSIMLLTIMLPLHVTLVPQFVIYHHLGLVGTIFPLIIPKFLAHDAFFIFLITQFIRGIPKELDESATIDGCGPFQIYLRIIVPLVVPAIITTAIFTFISSWDDFFSQMIYLNQISKFTVQLGLRMFIDTTGNSDWGGLLAMSLVSILPSILVFFGFQKYFVQGITTTGLK